MHVIAKVICVTLVGTMNAQLPADMAERAWRTLRVAAEHLASIAEDDLESRTWSSVEGRRRYETASEHIRAFQAVVSSRDVGALFATFDRATRTVRNVSGLYLSVFETMRLLTAEDVEPLVTYTPTLAVRQSLVLISDQLLRELARNPKLLMGLSPRQFEELIADLFRRANFDVELTRQTRDGGYDIIAVSTLMDVPTKLIIECKRYSHERKVDVGVVRQLLGAKLAHSANKAILATTSFFTHPALELARDRAWDLALKDYDAVLQWLRAVKY